MAIRIVQLMASPFVGGPERQMLGLARTLPFEFETIFLSFAEHGQATAFLDLCTHSGFQTGMLRANTPHLCAAVHEVAEQLRDLDADLLCCNGYKPDIVGWLAARRIGIPVVAVAHGWTAVTTKVRLYETLDRWLLRRMDGTVCVSSAQAEQLRRAHVPADRLRVIHNAIAADASADVDPEYRQRLLELFPETPRAVVGAAGRLSPEKGLEHLIDAAALCRQSDPGLGFVVFGDGPLRQALEQRIAARNLQAHFILAGFHDDWLRFVPHLSLLAMPSLTEGMPVVLLEALAAGLPAVASAVGGIPEVIDDGVNGFLVPPSDAPALARRLLQLAHSETLRTELARQGRQRVREQFSLSRQSEQYQELFEQLLDKRARQGSYSSLAHAKE